MKINLTTELNCVIYKDYVRITDLEKGFSTQIDLPIGKHILVFENKGDFSKQEKE